MYFYVALLKVPSVNFMWGSFIHFVRSSYSTGKNDLFGHCRYKNVVNIIKGTFVWFIVLIRIL